MDNSSNHASALHARLILSQGKRRAVEAKSVCRRVASSAHSILARVPPLEHLLFPQQQQQQQQQQPAEDLVAVRQSFGYSLTNVFS